MVSIRARFLSGSNWTKHCAKEINEHGSLSELTIYVISLTRKKRGRKKSMPFMRMKSIAKNKVTSQHSRKISLQQMSMGLRQAR